MNNNNRKNTPDTDATGEIISWVLVFIMLFAFTPVGIFLLIRKTHSYAAPSMKDFKQTAANTAEAARQAAYTAGNAAHQAAQAAGEAAQQAAYSAGNAARQAAHGAGDAARQAAYTAGNAARQAANTARYAARQAAPQYPVYTKQTMPGAYSNNIKNDFYKQPKAKSKKRSPLEKKSGKFISTILLLTSIVMFIIGITGVSRSILDIIQMQDKRFDISLIMNSFFLIGSIITFFSRNFAVRRISRYKNYYAFIAGRGIVPIQDIARASGLSVKTVTRDIQYMINDGYFGINVYIDSELDSLILSPEAAKEARTAKAESTVQKPPPASESVSNPFMSVILELRELNTSILDIQISDKIDCIEEITAKIFRIVEDHPEKQPQIRRFMNYYLPTTLKLLRSYATLEKQGVKGENIMSAKENIGRILDTLATGFEQQLDLLFKSDAIDIAADITVLENLMQQDGLTGDKPELKVMEGSSW